MQITQLIIWLKHQKIKMLKCQFPAVPVQEDIDVMATDILNFLFIFSKKNCSHEFFPSFLSSINLPVCSAMIKLNRRVEMDNNNRLY